MSYHNDLAKGRTPNIEMPPTAQEAIKQVDESKKQYDLHPDLQVALPQESEQEVEQVVENQTPNEEVLVKNQTPVETEKEKNIRNLRLKAERAEKAERERDELMRRLQEIEQKKSAPVVQPEEEDITLGNDDIVEGKHLSKYHKKLKEMQDELKSYKQQSELTSTEIRLKNEYPDFDKVVSRDNIELLRATYPEIANTINNSSSDIYSKAVSAYTMIKRLGISPEDIYQKEKEVAQKNLAKPRPVNSISPQQGDTPLSRANAFSNGLTDELKQQLRKEMVDAIKYR